MVGYNDGGDFNMLDSFNGHKFRPLVPRPVSSTTNNSSTLSRIHGAEIFALNHHHLGKYLHFPSLFLFNLFLALFYMFLHVKKVRILVIKTS